MALNYIQGKERAAGAASTGKKKPLEYNIPGQIKKYFGDDSAAEFNSSLSRIENAIKTGDDTGADSLISAERAKIEKLRSAGAAYFDAGALDSAAAEYTGVLDSIKQYAEFEYDTGETIKYTDSRSRTSRTENVRKSERMSYAQFKNAYDEYYNDLTALDEEEEEDGKYHSPDEQYGKASIKFNDLITRGKRLYAAAAAFGYTEAADSISSNLEALRSGRINLDEWKKTAGYSNTYFSLDKAIKSTGEGGEAEYGSKKYAAGDVTAAQEALSDINEKYAALSERANELAYRFSTDDKPGDEELSAFEDEVNALRGELSGLKEYTDVSDTRAYGRGLTGNAPEPTLKGSLLNRLISNYEKELDTLQNAAKDGSKLGYFGVNVWGGVKAAVAGAAVEGLTLLSPWDVTGKDNDIEDSKRYLNNPEYSDAPKREDFVLTDEQWKASREDILRNGLKTDAKNGAIITNPYGYSSFSKEGYENRLYEEALKKYNETKSFKVKNKDSIELAEIRDAVVLKANAGEGGKYGNFYGDAVDKSTAEAMKALGADSANEMFSVLAEHYGNFSEEESKAWRLLYSPSKTALKLAADNDMDTLSERYGSGGANGILNDTYYIEDEYKRTYKTDTGALETILNDGSVRNAFTLGNLTEGDYEYLYDEYGISKFDVDSVNGRFKTTIETLKNDLKYGNGLSEKYKEFMGGIAQSMGMMVPAAVVNFATAGIGGAVGAGALASSTVSFALFTAPVITTSYEQSISEGHLPNEAKKYAIVQGISEGATELVFSGFGNIANSVAGRLLSKAPVVKYYLKAAARSTLGQIAANAAKILGSSAGEFGEEYLQQFLEPLYRNYAYGEDNEADFFNRDNFKAGLAGAVVGGLMSGFSAAVGTGAVTYGHAKESKALNKKTVSLADLKRAEISLISGKEAAASATFSEKEEKKIYSAAEMLMFRAARFGEGTYSAKALEKAGITVDYEASNQGGVVTKAPEKFTYAQIAALETAYGRDAAFNALPDILTGEGAKSFIEQINSSLLPKELKENIINYNSIDEVAKQELKNNKRVANELVDAIFYAGFDVSSPVTAERQKNILARADQTTRISTSPAKTVQNMISRYQAVLSPMGINVAEATVSAVGKDAQVSAAAYYDSVEKTIYYSRDIQDAEALNFKLAHEIVEALIAEGYGDLVSDVAALMKESGVYDEETITDILLRYRDFYTELYTKKNQDAGLFGTKYVEQARARAAATVTTALAEKEAVCDYIGALAKGGELLRTLEEMARENTESGKKAKNLLARIYEAVKRFIKKFRRGGQNKSNIEYDDLVKLEKRLRSFVEEKTGRELKHTGESYTATEDRAYTVSEENQSIKEQLKNHSNELNNMKPVATIESEGRKGMSDEDRDVYEALLEKYGAIKSGMEPRAEGERPVPKKNAEGKKISETARTVAEAEITTDEAYDTIRKLITEGKLTVETVDKKSVMEAADAALEATGINGAVADIKARFAAGDNISAVDIAKLQLAYNSLVNAGGEYDIEAIEEVIALMALAGTKTGQALNAFKYVKSLSPSFKLYMFNSVLDNINKILEKKWKKKFKKITIPAEMSENLLNSKTKDEQFEAEEAIKDYIAKETPVSVWDKLNAWRYLSMLGNPKTHLRNISGNVAMFGTRVAKDQVQAILEVVFEKMGVLDESERRKSFGYIPFAYIKAGASEFDALAGELIGGGKYNDKSGLEGDILDRRKIYRGDNWLSKALEWARTTNGWLLDKEDLIFIKSNFALSFGQIMRARKISLADYYNGKVSAEVISDIARLASKEALRMTFRDSSALANAVRKLSNSSNFLKGVTDAALPFKKTPANILTRALEYSPLGLMKSIFSDLHKVKQGELSVSGCIEHFAEGLTGTGIMLLGCMLAKWGILRSGEDDDDEEDFERLLGRQKFSIEIGGKSFTIDWITPISTPIIMGGTFYERFLSESKEYQNPTEFFSDMLLSISSLADPFVELSMLSGVSEALDAFSGKSDSGPGESALAVAVSLAESYASQYIPTLLGQITRSVFPARRSTKVDPTDAIPDSIEYNIRKLANKIPFALNMNQKYVDEWGNEQTSEGTLENIGNTLENFFSPAYVNNVDEDEVEAALRELYTSTGEKSILPKWIKNKFTVSGKEYRLSDKQYSQGQKTFGQTAYSLIYEIVTSKAYKDMNDTEKVSAINKAYSYAQEAFRYEYAGEHLTDSKKMNGIYDECGTNKLDTAAKIFMCDAVITEKDMKGSAEKRAYINNANYNDEDKAVLFNHLAATKTDTEAISAAEKAGAGKKEIQSMILKFAALEPEEDEDETADDDERADSIASKQKISVIAGLDMDDKKKLKILKVFVSDKKDKDDPDKETAYEKLVTASESGISVEDYITCRYAINDIESDKYKSGKNKGKTVPGSKKKKVVKYINGLKITSAQKLLLFKQSGYQVKKGVSWRDILNSIK